MKVSDVACISDVGLVRKNNEDSWLINEKSGLFAVADGMGGHENGELASKYVVNHLKDFVNETTHPVRIKMHIKEASAIILLDRRLGRSGTTLCMSKLNEKNKTIDVFNVGDSRCYVQFDKYLKQITKDHNSYQQLIDNGVDHKNISCFHKNMLTNHIGIDGELTIDHYEQKLIPGSKILLCTDGLHGEVDDERILDVLQSKNRYKTNKDKLEALLRSAKRNGAKDNITMILFTVV